jgi:dienelactone hydrolase
MKIKIVAFFMFVFITCIQAQVKKEVILYQDGDVQLEGFLTYDKLLKSKRGGVLIIHDKYGLNEFIKKRAEEIAKLGYVAFALDMFGKDININGQNTIEEILQPFFEEKQELRPHRAQLGLDILTKHSKVDASHVAVIGYGFGGLVAMDIAQSGADLSATINFFGNFATDDKNTVKNIKGPVLILKGSDDKYLSEAELESSLKVMKPESNDWQINTYGGAVRGFTYYELGFDVSTGEAYNYNAYKRSWEAVKILLHETLK